MRRIDGDGWYGGAILATLGLGDLSAVVERGHVGGGAAGVPALGIGSPSCPVPGEVAAEHLVDRIVDRLVARREERHEIGAGRAARWLLCPLIPWRSLGLLGHRLLLGV